MRCIVCGEPANKTTIKQDIEAAFCESHYPHKQREIIITICMRY